MATDRDETKTTFGCLFAIMTICVTLPIWYALLFWLLWNANAPTWAWAAYWVYVPAGLVSAAAAKAVELL